MKNKITASLALLFFLFSGLAGWSQNPTGETVSPSGVWKDISEISLPETEREIPLPEKYRLLELGADELEVFLQTTIEQKDGRQSARKVVLDVPMPDGSFQPFEIEHNPVMHPDLSAKFPDIHSFSGVGIGQPGAKVYFTYSPVGFRALVRSSMESQVLIEPVQKSGGPYYISYFQNDAHEDEFDIGCSVLDGIDFDKKLPVNGSRAAGDCQFRTYRLAIATTAEFTAASIGPGDLTGVNTTMANINTLVTFMNGVFINEFAIQFQLIANNNLLIFTNPADGLTDGNQNAMAGENQGVIDGIIGAANYDVGHALGTNVGGGSAGVSLQIGNACVNGNKANAATIMTNVNPIGVGTMVLIMHEFGHQFAANHTFNDNSQPICSNAGQFNAGTAFEPGSGSTIMSYAGTCGSVNVQGFRDQYFHAISLQEVATYVTVGGGSGCPVTVPLVNNAPTVTAAPVASYDIPISTPFVLTATANDMDGDALTYCWEQFDNQAISHPPQSTAPNGPVFRTFLPSNSPERYFPNLPAILSGTSPTWEVLPSVSRAMNFIVTVRDNAAGGGCTIEDFVQLDVTATSGPFTVDPIVGPEPDCLFAEDDATITWDVANTTAPPVSCANVDILLSLDGGVTFPIVLADDTPNDGSQIVAIPVDAITEQGRIMIMASDNVFFDINDNDIRIDCPIVQTVTDNPAAGTYKARERVETLGDVTVLSGSSARFYAGEEVRLTPGFWAQSGSDFLARIQPCDPCVSNRPEALLVSDERPQITFFEVPLSMQAQQSGTSSMENVFVFPNPSGQDFTVQFEMLADGIVDIELFDLTGRQIQNISQGRYFEKGMQKITIPGSHLKNGVYHCRVNINGKNTLLRLLKMN